MDDMVELRCKYCGAPLDRKDIESDSPYITCPSCGTTQQRLDARKYMEQMMGQIQSWIAKTIPGGFAMGSVDNVDPVARHSIYVNSVKPRVDVEINEYRFALNSVIASPLIVLPFSKGEPVRSDHTSTQAFEFQARLKSVEPMAVDDESRKSIVTGEGIANAYAMILNNSKLLTETGSPGRFAIMSKNFLESADAMARCEGYEPLASRLRALSDVCAASDMVLNGDALGCSAKAEEGLAELEAAKRELLSSPRLAVTLRAVDMEISQTRTLKNVADMVNNGTSKDPLKTLTLINGVASAEYPDNPQWNRLLTSEARDFELYGYVNDVVAAKNGGAIPICQGGGDSLIAVVPIGVMFAQKLRLDPISGASISLLGTLTGFACRPGGSYTAQSIMGITLYSGYNLRLVFLLVTAVVGALYVTWYAKRIEKDPSKSAMGDLSWQADLNSSLEMEEKHITGRDLLITALFIAQFPVAITLNLSLGLGNAVMPAVPPPMMPISYIFSVLFPIFT